MESIARNSGLCSGGPSDLGGEPPGDAAGYHGASEGGLEYDFIVAPGADTGAIRLAVSGARRLHLAGDGDLVADTSGGQLVRRRPVA